MDCWKKIALYTMIALGAAVSFGRAASAEPTHVVSNMHFAFDATLLDSATAQDVTLVGLLHVQTKVHSPGGVEVHVNMVPGLFSAYSHDDGGAEDPELAALRERIRELRLEINDLSRLIKALLAEIKEVTNTDSEPLIPGHQIDKDRLADLHDRLTEAYSAMKRAAQEVQSLQSQIQERINELQKQVPELIEEYKALGAHAAQATGCTEELLCDALVSFDLIRDDGSSLPFQLRLFLEFTEDGELLSADAIVDGETLDCGGDSEYSCS